MISINDLRFAWPKASCDTLRIPSLHIPAGQRVFLHGPSGCGKSTLLGLMAGVLAPQAGQLNVLETELTRLSPSRRDAFRADHVGLVFQQFNLLPYLSVLDNVCLPCGFSALRSQRALAAHATLAAAAQDLLRQMHLPVQTWRQPAGRLSVGQQQRVAAARALMGEPEVIIADEPTSALDAPRRADFMQLLMSACTPAHARTLVFVSHDDRLAEGFDTVLSMEQINHQPAHWQ